MPENTQDLREQLIAALKSHDWLYEYTDDFSAWSRGNEQRKIILSLVAQVPDGQALYAQYKPKN